MPARRRITTADGQAALAAWRSGVPYYDAFCINYDPVTEAGAAQCTGIENGTVDSVIGEYIGV